jgi:hypothetical protein
MELPVSLIQDRSIAVAESPGMGFTDLNHDLPPECVEPDKPAIFEPTQKQDRYRLRDCLRSYP